MKSFKFITSIMCLLVTMPMFAQQHHTCGLHDHHLLIERLLENKKYLLENGYETKDAVSYVPVKYHIIGKSDESGRQSPKKIMDMHCSLNEFFAEGDDGIQFYIYEGFNYIDNTAAYSNHTGAGGSLQLQLAKVDEAINIYIPQDATPSGGPPTGGVILGYYSPGTDWIVIRKADANGTSLTAPHELGHYFSLPHPFNGWEGAGWAGVTGNTAPATSPGGTPTELVDGSNCGTAGDFICDTPPSYLFFGFNGCNYNGGAMDPTGAIVNPDENNIMDYFDDQCGPKYFTPEQKALISADYNNRGILHTNYVPNAVDVADNIATISPADDASNLGFDHVAFEWDAVEGADRYLLEIDRLSDFSLNPTFEIVFGTNKDLWGAFEADKTYHWRVTPFNKYNTCAASSTIQSFSTGTTTSSTEVLEVSDWNINPNPVSQNNMMLSIETADAFDAEISIVSTIGQTLQTKLHHFTVGNTTLEMSVENIPNGMYLVNVRSGNKIINKKIVVAK